MQKRELLYWSVCTQLLVFMVVQNYILSNGEEKTRIIFGLLLSIMHYPLWMFSHRFLFFFASLKNCIVVSLLFCVVGYFVLVGWFGFFVCLFFFFHQNSSKINRRHKFNNLRLWRSI